MPWFSRLTRWLKVDSPRRRATRAARAARRGPCPLRLEWLEDRCVPAIGITEFSNGITQPAGPYGIVPGPDGNLWFTEFTANQIARITPNGVVTEYNQGLTPNSNPQGITAGPDGNLWFTEYTGNQIGRINPAIGAINEYPVPTPASRPYSIVAGPDGNLWFTENGAGASQIASINPATGAVTEFGTSNGISPASGPLDIVAGPDGNLWFTENASNKIGRINPTTRTITEFGGLPPGGSPQGITAGPDGNLYFVENGGGRGSSIDRITTAGTVTVFANLPSGADPREIVVGPDANFWFTDGNGNAIGTVNLATAAVTEYTTGLTPNSTPQNITLGRDGNLWFTEHNSGKIGRVQAIPAATTITLANMDTSAPVYGDTVVFTASVGVQVAGVTAPTSGVVLFRDGSRVIGASALAGGLAVFSTDALSAGTHSITASYVANNAFLGSTSAVLSEVVAPASTSITVSSTASPSTAGQLVTYTATVSATNSFATPTGYVTFSDGNTVIGTSTLSGGLAVLSTTPTLAGAHTINAAYTPAANFLPSSTATPFTEQIVAGAATQVLFGQQPTFSFINTAFNPTVTAYFADNYGNLVNTPGSVTVSLANNPSAATLAGFTTAPAINGVASFANLTVNRAGTGYTLQAASQELNSAASAPFTIGSATHFGLSAPSTVQLGLNGASFSMAVAALTSVGTVDTLYQGTVAITATMTVNNVTTKVTLLPSYTFNATDKGRHLFQGLMLPAAGRWTVTVTDSRKASVSGQATVTVTTAPAIIHVITPAPTATHLGVAAPASVMTNTGFSLTVSALTDSGSLFVPYQGTVSITATNGLDKLSLVSSYTFTAADKGRHVFTGLAIPTAGRWTITATDLNQATVVGQAVMTVTAPPEATHFRVTAPSSVMTGTGFTLRVTALTASSALDTWYQGTITIAATSGLNTVSLISSYTFTAADKGRHAFTGLAGLTVGRWTITVTDQNQPTVLGQTVMTVTAPPPATHFRALAPSSVKTGTNFSMRVTALTAANAVAAWYQGTIAITATNGTTTLSLLPSYPFTAADRGQHTFTLDLPMAGRWTITVADTSTPNVLGRVTVTATAPPASDPPMLMFPPMSVVQPASHVLSPYPFVRRLS